MLQPLAGVSRVTYDPIVSYIACQVLSFCEFLLSQLILIVDNIVWSRYFIPMGCSKIYAQPSTVTGSIGVISAKFSSAALLERFKIWTAVTTAGHDRFAGMQHAAHRPWSEEEWERMNHWTREIYDGIAAPSCTLQYPPMRCDEPTNRSVLNACVRSSTRP